MLRTLPGPRATAAAVAHAPPRALGRLARAARRDRRARARARRRPAPTAAPASPPDVARARGPRAGRRSARPRPTTTTRSAPGPENRDQVENVVDSDPNTTWSTEHYYDGTLKKAGGVGRRAVPRRRPGRGRARRSRSRRPTPGFAVQIYVANHIDARAALRRLDAADRARLAGPGRGERLRPQRRTHPARRSPGSRYRYYLVWITTLPPRHAVGVDRRAHAVQVSGALSSGRRAAARGARAPAGRAGRRAPGRRCPRRPSALRTRSSG